MFAKRKLKLLLRSSSLSSTCDSNRDLNSVSLNGERRTSSSHSLERLGGQDSRPPAKSSSWTYKTTFCSCVSIRRQSSDRQSDLGSPIRDNQRSQSQDDMTSHNNQTHFFARFYQQRIKTITTVADPDLHRTVPQLIESRGFKCDTHSIVTKDGYILNAHRIVNPTISKPGYPVICQHGLLSAGSDFVLNSLGGGLIDEDGVVVEQDLTKMGNNLGFELSKRGYDVWLTNSRGNTYSTGHLELNQSDKRFWDFSFDEMIEFDLPATIDYVLNETSSPTLGYVGHSQGNLIMFGLLATQFKYNQLIKPFIALSPVTTVGFVKSPVKILAESPLIVKLFKKLGGPFMPSSELIKQFATRSNLVPHGLIVRNFNLLFGYNSLDFKRLPVYMAHSPAGTSTKNLVHFVQGFLSKQFRKFDYGPELNQLKYNQLEPPEYMLEKITNKDIALVSSLNDWFCDQQDVELLRKRIGVRLMADLIVEDDSFNHLDFLFGTNVAQLINPIVINLLQKTISKSSSQEATLPIAAPPHSQL